jgi:hypothetical protein
LQYYSSASLNSSRLIVSDILKWLSQNEITNPFFGEEVSIFFLLSSSKLSLITFSESLDSVYLISTKNLSNSSYELIPIVVIK